MNQGICEADRTGPHVPSRNSAPGILLTPTEHEWGQLLAYLVSSGCSRDSSRAPAKGERSGFFLHHHEPLSHYV